MLVRLFRVWMRYNRHHMGRFGMGRVAKGVRCSVSGCDKPAVRSISVEKASAAGLEIGNVRRAYLCEKHYKELKRRSKKERMLEKWRWGAQPPH